MLYVTHTLFYGEIDTSSVNANWLSTKLLALKFTSIC